MQEKKKLQINKYLFISIASICAGIFVWWLVTDGLGIFRSNALPSPVKVASTFVKKWFETKRTAQRCCSISVPAFRLHSAAI